MSDIVASWPPSPPLYIPMCIFVDYLFVNFDYIVCFQYHLKVFTGKILPLDKCVTSLIQIPVILSDKIYLIFNCYPLSSRTISSFALFHEKRDSPESSTFTSTLLTNYLVMIT